MIIFLVYFIIMYYGNFLIFQTQANYDNYLFLLYILLFLRQLFKFKLMENSSVLC